MHHAPQRPRLKPNGLSNRRLPPIIALLSLLALLLLVPACGGNSATPGGDPPGTETPPEDPPPEGEPPTEPAGPYLVMGYSLHSASPIIVIHPSVGDRKSVV